MATFNGSGIDANNTLVDPTGLSVVSSTNVQGAIEELDAASGGGGGGDLAATLVLGNITDGTDIVVSDGDVIKSGPTAATVHGLPLVLTHGDAADASYGALIWVNDQPGVLRGDRAIDLQSGRPGATYIASGDYSAALGGYGNTASGFTSVTVGGNGNTASGNYSFASGFGNSSESYASHVEGAFNSAEVPLSGSGSDYNHVEGGSNVAASPYGAHAEGLSNRVSNHPDFDVNGLYGRAGHVEGSNNRLYGNYSHAEGTSNVNYGSYGAHVEGEANNLAREIPSSGWNNLLTASWDTYRVANDRPYAVGSIMAGQGAHVEGTLNNGLPPFSHTGGREALTTIPTQWSRASGRPSSNSRYGIGSSQTSILSLQAETNGAVTTELFTNSSTQSFYAVIRQNTAQAFRARVVAVADTTAAGGIAEAASWEFTGLVRRNAYLQAGAQNGTGSIVVTGAPLPTPGDTVTINGPLGGPVVLTAVAGARTPGGGDFSLSSGTAAGIALDLRDAIRDIRNGVLWLHLSNADNAGSSVDVDAYPLGTNGNAVTVATSNAAAFTVTGALTGGVDTTLTLVGVSSAGATAPLYADAGAVSWTAELLVDATKQSLDIRVSGEVGKRISWHATLYTSETGRDPL